MTDDTRDIVIELRSVVLRLEKAITSIEGELKEIRAERNREDARNSLLLWLGAGVLAAAGGTGAVVAKWLGWATTVAR